MQLITLSVIEILYNQTFHDIDIVNFYAPYNVDPWLKLLPSYTFIKEIVHNTTVSDMLSVMTLSSVVNRPVQTLWPIIVNSAVESPMTKLVIGRQIQSIWNAIYKMWTSI